MMECVAFGVLVHEWAHATHFDWAAFTRCTQWLSKQERRKKSALLVEKVGGSFWNRRTGMDGGKGA